MASNNTAWWNGGGHWIDGLLQGLNRAYAPFSMNWTDTDSDGIPDEWDPYVYDSTNNTVWWDGGTSGGSTASTRR